MFKNLSERLGQIFDKLKRRGALSESDVSEALREIRIALLEADVALPVVKSFIEQVKEKAIGQEVLQSITPGQMVVKIVHDHLIEVLGTTQEDLNLKAVPPVVILMVGLQGSGKTTSTAKLAWYLSTKLRKSVMMASTDIYRPAAQHQLAVLGEKIGVPTLDIREGEKPLQIAERAYETAKRQAVEVLFIDTAGRLHMDEALMKELVHLRNHLKPTEILLVGDAMTGQDAVKVAQEFHAQVGLTGIMLTRVDGDARGGAALSMRSVTGCPIKFVGMGERFDQIEPFHPDRMADRILDMGDVVTLVERAVENIDRQEAEALAKKVQKGKFDLDDLAAQLRQISKMGGLSGLLGMLPGVGRIKDQLKASGVEDKAITHQLAIISSMTLKERQNVDLLNASRKRRIAEGSGRTVPEVNRLLKQYLQMRNAMKRMTQMGEKGLRRQGFKDLFRMK